MNQLIYEKLTEAAKKGDIINYADVAPLANLDMSLDKDRAEIGRILGDISSYEQENGRPLISAIMIHKHDGRPGIGFFHLAKELGLLKTGDDEDRFWNEEVKKVFAYWKNK